MSQVLAFATDDAHHSAALTDELSRIATLIGVTARHREGKTATAEQKRDLQAIVARVIEARKDGFWADLLGLAEPPEPLACDAMAVALYPMAWPSRALALAALQSGISEPVVCQALLHELLMVGPEEETALHRVLSPTGPLLAQHWLQVEGSGPARLIRPGPRLIRCVLGDEGFGTLPAGISLADDGSAPLSALILRPETERALDEVAALACYTLEAPEAQRRAGPAVLLTGPPGTGKSLAAFHLSRRIERPMFQLNLGTIVSKWLGETERNLSRVFDQMSGTRGAILIDECDALLGKRVSVKEGRDHYVNLTVSHLLMLLERHKGPVWLTSNLRTNLDDAYLRRFSAVVEFKRPDFDLRIEAWKREIGDGLPAATRQHLAELAATVDLSAAEIASACHYGKALAHAADRGLTAADVARAVMRERTKSIATFTRNDLLALAPFVEEDAP
ncbi:MAG: ATP-binding protein [Rhodobacter sp.]|nr:ATP-binding protein [Rhodobacter sp.]